MGDDVLGCIAGQVWHTGKLETQGQAQNRRPNVTVTGKQKERYSP